MIKVRKAGERGRADHGWLKAYHTFSFADYYDPQHIHFRNLRVLNEDRIQPGQGFGEHSHQDMEILTCVLEGALEHKDSMGNTSVIKPGEFQRMSAGTGVTHSEFNHSDTAVTHLLQIWFLPKHKGLKPGYEQKSFPEDEKLNRLRLIASPDGGGNALTIHQDIKIYDSMLEAGKSLVYEPENGHVWIQVTKGGLSVSGEELDESDGAAVSMEKSIRLEAAENASFLLFDLK